MSIIQQAPVTIVAQSRCFTYNGEVQSWNYYDVEGLFGTDAITAVVTGSITFPSESPAANVVTSYAFTSGNADNYAVTTRNGQLTMRYAPVEITITAASESWVYDGNAHSNSTVSVTSGNLLDGDSLVATATGSVTNVADTATGNNPVAAGYKIMHGTEDVTEKYEITTVAGTLTINPASVTLTANSGEYTYDGTEKTVTGFKSSVSCLTFTGVTASGHGTNAGEYAVTFSGVTLNETKDSTGNYVFTGTTNGKLTIRTKAITVKADDKTKVYDNDSTTDPELTATVEGVVKGDTLDYTLSRAEGEDVGTYAITVTLGENPNYDVTATNGNFTITKAAQEAPAAPTAQEITDNSVTLAPVEGMEYRLGDGEWQTSNVFGNLETGTKYTFYQRLAADENHEPSESS